MTRSSSSVKIISIPSEETGRRIDNFLRTQLKSLQRNTIYRLLRKGKVRINKKRVKPEYKLKTGDVVRIPPIHWAFCKKNTILPNLKKMAALSEIVLYEDDHLLILNKPSGMAVHGGSSLAFGVIEGLRILRPKEHFLSLVHRLDRDTSGLLLVAKKRSALRELHEQLRKKTIKKDYLALVRGQWESHIKIVRAPLRKDIQKCGKRIVRIHQLGKTAETHFKVEEYYGFATLLRCSPLTGRTHQIRIHAQHMNHPIAFDLHYGDKKFNECLLFTGLSRLFLHAISLRFIHPNTGEIMKIEAPMDTQLTSCIKILRASMSPEKQSNTF